MYSSEDLEKFWFLYKLEGQPKNLSIESFCLQQGISYRAFYKWFSCRKKSIVPVEIIGLPQDSSFCKSTDPAVVPSIPASSISGETPIESVSILLENGLQISRHHLSYLEFQVLVEKLEVLC